MSHCERFYGSAFVFNPDRWGTRDGYLPYRVCVAAALAMQAVRAAESLHWFRVLHPPGSRHKAESLIADLVRTAQPEA